MFNAIFREVLWKHFSRGKLHVLEKNAKLDKKGSFSSFLLLPLKKLIYASYGCIGFIDKPLG